MESGVIPCKRQNGESGLIAWGSFSWNNQSNLVFIDGKINSAGYTNILQNNLKIHSPHLANDNYIFQQDNALIHILKATKQQFNMRNMTLVDFPSSSPDLNPMENMWENLRVMFIAIVNSFGRWITRKIDFLMLEINFTQYAGR